MQTQENFGSSFDDLDMFLLNESNVDLLDDNFSVFYEESDNELEEFFGSEDGNYDDEISLEEAVILFVSEDYFDKEVMESMLFEESHYEEELDGVIQMILTEDTMFESELTDLTAMMLEEQSELDSVSEWTEESENFFLNSLANF